MSKPTGEGNGSGSHDVDKDSRTLLPGRDSFYRNIQPLIEDTDTRDGSLVLIDIDVIGLDFILRTFGPVERDTVIQGVGRRIRERSRGDNSPYHITQDRFALILSGDYSYQQVIAQARSIVEALKEPFEVAGVMYKLDAYAGISHYPNHAASVAELVRTSVFACHQARENRSGVETFDKKLDEWERQRFQLMVELEQALNGRGGIRMAYQPQVDFDTGKPTGAEALCRWQHPTLGYIPPDHFLPYVEHTALMLPLTETTLGKSLEDLGSTFDLTGDFALSVNLSPALLLQPDLLERLQEQFRYYNVSPERVYFEVTESGVMEQPKRAVNVLKAIRKTGSLIAIDDFGTGHSSLAYLADLPVDIIKIDQHFIHMLDLPWGEAVVGATAVLAEKLGLKTIAEGIEDVQQYEKCRELGVTCGQGFYISKPVFKDEFEDWFVQMSVQ